MVSISIDSTSLFYTIPQRREENPQRLKENISNS